MNRLSDTVRWLATVVSQFLCSRFCGGFSFSDKEPDDEDHEKATRVARGQQGCVG